MWNWLIPAAISAIGGGLQNRSSAKAARENRQFQERMSSSAFQRSAKDAEAAGFNPMLAIDRPASSPGGSVAQVEDAVQKGVSSGMAARQFQKQMAMQERQVKTQENLELNDRTRTAAQSQVAGAQVDELNARAAQTRALQPHMVSAQELANQWQRYQNVTGKYDSQFAQTLGAGGPLLRMLGPVLGRLVGPLAGLMQKPAPRGGITINNRVKP